MSKRDSAKTSVVVHILTRGKQTTVQNSNPEECNGDSRAEPLPVLHGSEQNTLSTGRHQPQLFKNNPRGTDALKGGKSPQQSEVWKRGL